MKERLALAFLAIGVSACGKTPVDTDSRRLPATATVVEGQAGREASAPLGKDHSELADTKETRLRLERTGCRGECPSYSVELHGDGAVRYEGKSFVCKSGKQTATVDPAGLVALAARFREAGFFQMEWADPCETMSKDLPTAKVTFTTGLRTRTITDDHGNGCMPKVVRDLEEEIDRVTGTARWVTCSADAPSAPARR